VPSVVHEDVNRISPLRGRTQPERLHKETERKRRCLGKALHLEGLWTPKCVRSTIYEDGPRGKKVAHSTPNGVPVSLTSHLPGFSGKNTWSYPRLGVDVSCIDERVGLFQRTLHLVAENGLSKSEFRTFNRVLKVGFQIPIKHLRKMVRSLVASQFKRCKQVLVTRDRPLKRSSQKPSLTGEKKSNRKIGYELPLWKWTPLTLQSRIGPGEN